MVKTKQTMLAQLIARAVIFFLLLLGIFVVVPGLRYLFILFIIANIVLGFINHKKDIFMNIGFIILTPLLFIPILEYLITVILLILIGINLVMFYLWFREGGVEEVKDKKKKFHFSGWLIAILIIAGIIFMLLVIIALLFFSTTSIG